MIWWLRTHRGPALLVLTIVPSFIVAMTGDFAFLFPALQGSTPFSRVALSAAIPVIPTVALSTSLNAGSKGTYAVASRRTLVGDALLAVAIVLIASATMLAALPLGAAPAVVEAGIRNTAADVGLATLAGGFVGYRLQAIAPVVYLVVASLFGREPGDTVAFWAWPVGAGDDPGFLLVPAVLGLFAASVLLRRIAGGHLDTSAITGDA